MEIMQSISFLLGAALTILSTYLINRNQLKRDRNRYEQDLKLEKIKNEFERDQSYRIELLSDLERLNKITIGIEHSISLTSSLIESERELSRKDFDLNHQEQLKDINELESLTISKFTDIYSSVRAIGGLHSQYWGSQRNLLAIDYNKDSERYISVQKRIITIQNEARAEIYKIQSYSLSVAEKIRNKLLCS